MFLKYDATKGRHFMLRPEQIRALEGNDQHTRIYASVAGSPITFLVLRPYREIATELEQAIRTAEEMAA